MIIAQPTFKGYYLGYGLYWTSIYVCFQSTVLMGASLESMEHLNVFFLTSVCVGAVMHVAFAIILMRYPGFAYSGLSPITIAAILSLGICAVGLSAMLGQEALPLLVSGAVVHGVCSAWIDVLWFNTFGRINPERSSLYILLSFVVAVVLYFAVVWTAAYSLALGLALNSLLVIASGLMLHLCCRNAEADSNEDGNAVERGRALSFNPAVTVSLIFKGLWRPLAGAATFSLLYAFFDRMTSINATHFIEAHIISLFACVIITLLLLVFVRVRPHKADLSFVSKVALPLLILSCMLLPALGGITTMWSSTLFAIGFTLFDIMLFVLIAELAYEHSLDGGVIEGLVRGIIMVFFAIGGFAGYSIVGLDIDGLVLVMITLALVNLVIIGASTLLSSRQSGDLDSIILSESLAEASSPSTHEGGVGISPDAPAEPPPAPAEPSATRAATSAGPTVSSISPAAAPLGAEGPTPSSAAASAAPAPIESDEGIWAIADRFSLSKRESEVFSYLARGRTIAYISKELFLSEHTVRTHVRHIYEKMDVHSRQELLDLTEGFSKDSAVS